MPSTKNISFNRYVKSIDMQHNWNSSLFKRRKKFQLALKTSSGWLKHGNGLGSQLQIAVLFRLALLIFLSPVKNTVISCFSLTFCLFRVLFSDSEGKSGCFISLWHNCIAMFYLYSNFEVNNFKCMSTFQLYLDKIYHPLKDFKILYHSLESNRYL